MQPFAVNFSLSVLHRHFNGIAGLNFSGIPYRDRERIGGAWMHGAEFDDSSVGRNRLAGLNRAGDVKNLSHKTSDDSHWNDGPKIDAEIGELNTHELDLLQEGRGVPARFSLKR